MQKRGVVTEISRHPVAFATVFLVLFTFTFIFLLAVGATPNPLSTSGSDSSQTIGNAADASNPENPVRIAAPSISLDTVVENPISTDAAVLDLALKQGAVHYPGSAPLGAKGTMLLFGHSSYLPVVLNQHYKTFDGIQTLKPGATVSVYSGTTEYRYSVTGVRVADSTTDNVNLLDQGSGKHLVLATCDSFAKKSNRFVVTADFVGAYALAQ
jgi:LPXTG-site transpeptidase (sortase) family protein